MTQRTKPILYIDMDNVLVDFPPAFPQLDLEILLQQYSIPLQQK